PSSAPRRRPRGLPQEDLLDQRFLMHGRALIGGVLDEYLIEDGAGHLPCDGAFVMVGLEEVEGARLLALRVGELHAVFADERTLFELLQKSHALKRKIGVGLQ